MEVKSWIDEVLEKGRASWFRVYGIPAHAWNTEFFALLANSLGTFICLDDNFVFAMNMNVSRIRVRVPFSSNEAESLRVAIDDKTYKLFLKEEASVMWTSSGKSLTQISGTAFVSEANSTCDHEDYEHSIE